MCPACMTAVAWIVAGATSTGGIAALVAGRFRRGSKRQGETDNDGSPDRDA